MANSTVLHYTEKEGSIGVYLRKHPESGALLPCDKNGVFFDGVISVEYRAGVDEITKATVSVHVCGIIDG